MYELLPYAGFGSLGKSDHDLGGLLGRFFQGAGLPAEPGREHFVPKVNVKETEGAIEITAEVPGLKPEDIELTLTGDILTLKGEKKDEREEKTEDYHLVERSYGHFQRSFRLPVEVDRAKLAATHKDGVLTVTLPKAGEGGTARIEVKGG
jgi:HSP20 family protein